MGIAGLVVVEDEARVAFWITVIGIGGRPAEIHHKK